MKIRNDGIAGKTVQQSGKKGKVSSAGSGASSTASVDNKDSVSLTSAAKMDELREQIMSMPIVDAQHVAAIQHQLGAGTYEADEEHAAENLVEIEKGFAEQE
jgi:flagellar biosynthesis anti-sigma factor FlgM